MKLKVRVRELLPDPNSFLLIALLHLCSDVTAADYPLQILKEPQFGYARQSLIVQPVIKVEGTAQRVQAFAGNSSSAFFGRNIIDIVSGFANFTDLGFSIPGEFKITFSADGIGNVESDNIIVKVMLVHCSRDLVYNLIVFLPRCVQSGLSSIYINSQLYDLTSMEEILPPPIAILRDDEGFTMPSCRVAVNARLLDAESAGAVLAGELNPSSCCRQPDCPPLACCDCSNPTCALCMMPNSSGMVVWSGLRIDVRGNYSIVFFVNEPVRIEEPHPIILAQPRAHSCI